MLCFSCCSGGLCCPKQEADLSEEVAERDPRHGVSTVEDALQGRVGGGAALIHLPHLCKKSPEQLGPRVATSCGSFLDKDDQKYFRFLLQKINVPAK